MPVGAITDIAVLGMQIRKLFGLIRAQGKELYALIQERNEIKERVEKLESLLANVSERNEED